MYIVFTLLMYVSTLGQTPCPRNQPVIAYHSELESIFLFGGYCSESNTRLNDLWKFTDGQWENVKNEKRPSARSGHAMVYDSVNNRLVLFGGKDNDRTLLNDTWIWDGNWQRISKEGPPARQSHRLVQTDIGILLFGGSTDERSLDDTWIFTENSWKEINTINVPPARRQHTLAFDSNRNVTILFGGFDRSDDGKTILGDTWEFDGNDWTKKADNRELARDHHSMSYSKSSKATVLFGGYREGYLGDTHFWDGKEWKRIPSQGPSARAGKPGLVAITSSPMLILFGGGDASNLYLMDFWKFDANSLEWSQD